MSDLDELFTRRRRAVAILAYVVSEWESDPDSVKSFDLRIVKEAKALVARIRELDPIDPETP